MGLLSDIQATLLEGGNLANALLKMRVLAARLGSVELAEWVRFEAEGYPPDSEVPPYRQLAVTYRGHFVGSFGREVNNAPIPDVAIQEFIGDKWLRKDVVESVAGIGKLITLSGDSGVISLSYSNFPLLLQGNVYPDFSCISVTGKISASALDEIVTVVRSKVLDLTLEIEKRIPEAKDVVATSPDITGKQQEVFKIMNQTIYGNINHIQNSGDHSTFSVNITQGNAGDVAEHLAKGGISETDAKDFSAVLSSEKPTSQDDPLGPKAKSWIETNISKAMSGVWKASLPVATALLTAAAERYYGLK